jgi:two-component system, NarL family, response regulator DesR
MAGRATGVTSERLSVAVCVKEPPHLDRVCAALTAGGHAVFARGASVESFLTSCNGNAPACVVIGADRPDSSAVEAVRMIRSKLEETATVMVCRSARGTELRRALELGVDGVVLRDDADQALGAVVGVVCVGQVSVPSGQRGVVRAQPLTTREKQTLALVVTGLTNAQIAGRLFLAESTVKSHLSSAFTKLGVSSRYEAATVILDPERGSRLGLREVQRDGSPVRTSRRTPHR